MYVNNYLRKSIKTYSNFERRYYQHATAIVVVARFMHNQRITKIDLEIETRARLKYKTIKHWIYRSLQIITWLLFRNKYWPFQSLQIEISLHFLNNLWILQMSTRFDSLFLFQRHSKFYQQVCIPKFFVRSFMLS